MFVVPEAAYSALMPLLRRLLDAETAHSLTLRILAAGIVRGPRMRDDPALAVRALGTVFPNPIGLAAGFDKDAVAIGPLMGLGFGFVEAGTVTPLPQAGNPKPRLFRLEQDRAVINRMGVQQCRADGLLRSLAGFIGANLSVRRQCRHQQGRRRARA